jgi:hypothetical protein
VCLAARTAAEGRPRRQRSAAGRRRAHRIVLADPGAQQPPDAAGPQRARDGERMNPCNPLLLPGGRQPQLQAARFCKAAIIILYRNQIIELVSDHLKQTLRTG